MFVFKESNWTWISFPCWLIGVHLLTYTVRIRLWQSERDILWKRRILLISDREKPLPFAGVRSVRIGTRGLFVRMWHLYFLLVDNSRLPITYSYLADRINAQGDALAKFIGRPLVYEQQNENETRSKNK